VRSGKQTLDRNRCVNHNECSLSAIHRSVALFFCSVLVISVRWIPMSARTDGDWGRRDIVHHRRCTGSTFSTSDKGEPVTLSLARVFLIAACGWAGNVARTQAHAHTQTNKAKARGIGPHFHDTSKMSRNLLSKLKSVVVIAAQQLCVRRRQRLISKRLGVQNCDTLATGGAPEFPQIIEWRLARAGIGLDSDTAAVGVLLMRRDAKSSRAVNCHGLAQARL
jgi:hypothetical protein